MINWKTRDQYECDLYTFTNRVFAISRLFPDHSLFFPVTLLEWRTNQYLNACKAKFKHEKVDAEMDVKCLTYIPSDEYESTAPPGQHYLCIALENERNPLFCTEPDVFIDTVRRTPDTSIQTLKGASKYKRGTCNNGDLVTPISKNYANRTFCTPSRTDASIIEHDDGVPFVYNLDIECAILDLIYPDGYELYGVEKISVPHPTPKTQDRYAVYVDELGKDGTLLLGLNKEDRSDPILVMAAVENNGDALQYASELLKNDPLIVEAAVIQTASAFEYASDTLKHDYGFVIKLVKMAPGALRYVAAELRNDLLIVMTAVDAETRKTGSKATAKKHILQYASSRIQTEYRNPTDYFA
jgi:hypothetical protein